MPKCESLKCKTLLCPGNVHKYCRECRAIKAYKDIQMRQEDIQMRQEDEWWSALIKSPPTVIGTVPPKWTYDLSYWSEYTKFRSTEVSNHARCLIDLAKMHNRTIQVYQLDGFIQPDKDDSIELYVPLKEYNVCLVVRK